MEEICGDSQDGEVRQLVFTTNNSVQRFNTFFLEDGEQITIAFKITNDDQQNVFRREGSSQQFVSKI